MLECGEVGMVVGDSPVEFSSNGALIFAASARAVSLYSTKTGEKLGVISVPSGVVSVQRSPANDFQIVVACRDSRLRIFDITKCTLVRELPLKTESGSIFAMVAQRTRAKRVFLCISGLPSDSGEEGEREQSESKSKKRKKRKARYLIVSKDLKSGDEFTVLDLKSFSGLAVSQNGSHLAALSDKSAILCALNSSKGSSKLSVGMRRPFVLSYPLTCVAFHPHTAVMAVGDQTGRITLCHFSDSGKQQQLLKSELHWHAHSVLALAFSDDGAYLLSGGEEAVLVTWQLDGGRKDFLPRLEAPILGITTSPTGTLHALASADNCVRVVSPIENRIVHSLRGIYRASDSLAQTHASRPSLALLPPRRRSKSRSSTKNGDSSIAVAPGPLLQDEQAALGIVAEPKSGRVVLGAAAGQLQFYDLVEDRHVSTLTVAPRNAVSRTHRHKAPAPSILCASFSANGQWLATVDKRHAVPRHSQNQDTKQDDDSQTTHYRSVSLKFWERQDSASDGDRNRFVLRTHVQSPHKGEIVDIKFHPTKPLAVTISRGSSDCSFQTWIGLAPDPSRKRKHVAWRSHGVGTYRGQSVSDVAFSSDGSVLAVAFGQVLTLWDPEEVVLLHTLVHSSDVRRFEYLPGTPWLVSFTADQLLVWNLLSLTIQWSQPLSVHALQVDSSIGISTRSPNERVFAVVSSEPEEEESTDCKMGDRENSDASNTAVAARKSRHRLLVFKGASPSPIASFDCPEVDVASRNSLVMLRHPRHPEALTFFIAGRDRRFLRSHVLLDSPPSISPFRPADTETEESLSDSDFPKSFESAASAREAVLSSDDKKKLWKGGAENDKKRLFNEMVGKTRGSVFDDLYLETKSTKKRKRDKKPVDEKDSSPSALSSTSSTALSLFQVPAHSSASGGLRNLLSSMSSVLLPPVSQKEEDVSDAGPFSAKDLSSRSSAPTVGHGDSRRGREDAQDEKHSALLSLKSKPTFSRFEASIFG